MSKAQDGKTSAYLLVRDRNGKPRFDDPDNIPPELWEMLTDDERKEIEHGRDTRRGNPH